MATTTLSDFLTAWKTKWTAAGATLSSIAGPYSDQEPPKGTPTFPYCVVTATSPLNSMSNSSATYRVVLDVNVYHSSKAAAATSIAAIKGVFTCEIAAMPTMATGKGTVTRGRVVGDFPTQEDDGVFRHRCTWDYLWETPRT